MADQRDRIVFLVAVVAFAVWIGADFVPGGVRLPTLPRCWDGSPQSCL